VCPNPPLRSGPGIVGNRYPGNVSDSLKEVRRFQGRKPRGTRNRSTPAKPGGAPGLNRPGESLVAFPSSRPLHSLAPGSTVGPRPGPGRATTRPGLIISVPVDGFFRRRAAPISPHRRIPPLGCLPPPSPPYAHYYFLLSYFDFGSPPWEDMGGRPVCIRPSRPGTFIPCSPSAADPGKRRLARSSRGNTTAFSQRAKGKGGANGNRAPVVWKDGRFPQKSFGSGPLNLCRTNRSLLF